MVGSGIYSGTIRHRRFTPKTNAFSYQLMMLYIDLDQTENLFKKNKWSLFRFDRGDYIDPHISCLKSAITQRVLNDYPQAKIAKIFLLSQIKALAYSSNPISCYYCFDKAGALSHLVLEVTNTPWGDKQIYVLECDQGQSIQKLSFNKAMHVSPFNPMDMLYKWKSDVPDTSIHIDLSCWRHDARVMDATLTLSFDKALDAQALPMHYAWMSYKITALIYIQAAKLYFFKKIPFYSHPNLS